MRKRVLVTPAGVEVVVPVGTSMAGPSGVLAFLHSKRRWVFNAVREINEQHRKLLTQQYASGAKLQYRGRWLMLDVQTAAVERVEIGCRSKFEVRVPDRLEGLARLEAVRAAFEAWLRARALRDLRRFARKHEAALNVTMKDARLSDHKRAWGTCGKDGVIRVHWRLAQAPAAAMEYVVAHEVVHLLHRNHSAEFWATLATTMPDWADRKMMLERWEGEHRAV